MLRRSKRYEATKFGCHVVWDDDGDIISAEIVDEDELLNAVYEYGEEVAD